MHKAPLKPIAYRDKNERPETLSAGRRKRPLLKLFAKNRLALIGSSVIFSLLMIGILAPLIAPHDPIKQQFKDLQPGFWAGNLINPLGTDSLGRDLLSRIIFGTRISLLVGIFALLIMVILGVTGGVIAGYFPKSDHFVQGLVDIMLAFPSELLAISIMAGLGPGVMNAMLALGIVQTPRIVRLVRGVVLSVKEETFIESCRAAGCPTLYIIVHHVIPNVIPVIITYSAIYMGQTILFLATLGFIGLGAQPPAPEWGAMIGRGKDYMILGSWWVSIFPGITIMLAVIGFVFLGDGLRDFLDPKMRGQE
jgi:peptide/nickel transport system permease protein